MTAHKAKTPSDLTDRVLQAIEGYNNANGYPPTLDEIGAAVYLSKSGVHRHVNILVESGRLVRARNKARSIRIVKEVHQ